MNGLERGPGKNEGENQRDEMHPESLRWVEGCRERERDGWEAAIAYPSCINPAEDNKKHFDRD